MLAATDHRLIPGEKDQRGKPDMNTGIDSMKYLVKMTEESEGVQREYHLTYDDRNRVSMLMISKDIPEVFYSKNLATGNNKNPMGVAFGLQYALFSDLAMEGFSENEILSMKILYGPNPLVDNKITYQYDKQQYPSSSALVEYERNNLITKTLYQYK